MSTAPKDVQKETTFLDRLSEEDKARVELGSFDSISPEGRKVLTTEKDRESVKKFIDVGLKTRAIPFKDRISEEDKTRLLDGDFQNLSVKSKLLFKENPDNFRELFEATRAEREKRRKLYEERQASADITAMDMGGRGQSQRIDAYQKEAEAAKADLRAIEAAKTMGEIGINLFEGLTAGVQRLSQAAGGAYDVAVGRGVIQAAQTAKERGMAVEPSEIELARESVLRGKELLKGAVSHEGEGSMFFNYAKEQGSFFQEFADRPKNVLMERLITQPAEKGEMPSEWAPAFIGAATAVGSIAGLAIEMKYAPEKLLSSVVKIGRPIASAKTTGGHVLSDVGVQKVRQYAEHVKTMFRGIEGDKITGPAVKAQKGGRAVFKGGKQDLSKATFGKSLDEYINTFGVPDVQDEVALTKAAYQIAEDVVDKAIWTGKQPYLAKGGVKLFGMYVPKSSEYMDAVVNPIKKYTTRFGKLTPEQKSVFVRSVRDRRNKLSQLQGFEDTYFRGLDRADAEAIGEAIDLGVIDNLDDTVSVNRLGHTRKQIAIECSKLFDTLRQQENLSGFQVEYLSHYFPHLYKDTKRSREIYNIIAKARKHSSPDEEFVRLMGQEGLAPTEAMQANLKAVLKHEKPRFFETMQDAKDFGLEPISDVRYVLPKRVTASIAAVEDKKLAAALISKKIASPTWINKVNIEKINIADMDEKALAKAGFAKDEAKILASLSKASDEQIAGLYRVAEDYRIPKPHVDRALEILAENGGVKSADITHLIGTLNDSDSKYVMKAFVSDPGKASPSTVNTYYNNKIKDAFAQQFDLAKRTGKATLVRGKDGVERIIREPSKRSAVVVRKGDVIRRTDKIQYAQNQADMIRFRPEAPKEVADEIITVKVGDSSTKFRLREDGSIEALKSPRMESKSPEWKQVQDRVKGYRTAKKTAVEGTSGPLSGVSGKDVAVTSEFPLMEQKMMEYALNPNRIKAVNAFKKTFKKEIQGTEFRPKGFVTVDKGDLKGYMIPEDVAKSINDLSEQDFLARKITELKTDPSRAWRSFGKVLSSIDKINNFYKTNLTTIWPAFHGRNALSNVVLATLGYGDEALNPTLWKYADELVESNRQLRSIHTRLLNAKKQGMDITQGKAKLGNLIGRKFNLKGNIKNIYGDTLSLDEAFGLMESEGLFMDISEKTRGLAMGQQTPVLRSKGVQTAISADTKMREIGSMIENKARVVAWMAGWKKGLSPQMAATQAKKFLMDYGNLAPLERNLISRIIPFYTFSRYNYPLMAEAMFKSPQWIGNQYRILNFLSRGQSLPEELKQIGQFGAAAFLGQDQEGRGFAITSGPFPTEDLARGVKLLQSSWWLMKGVAGESSLDRPIEEPIQRMLGETFPIITIAGEMAQNRDYKTGRKISLRGEETDTPLIRGNMSQYAGETIARYAPDKLKEWIGFRATKDRVTGKNKYEAAEMLVHFLEKAGFGRLTSSMGRLGGEDEELLTSMISIFAGVGMRAYDMQERRELSSVYEAKKKMSGAKKIIRGKLKKAKEDVMTNLVTQEVLKKPVGPKSLINRNIILRKRK